MGVEEIRDVGEKIHESSFFVSTTDQTSFLKPGPVPGAPLPLVHSDKVVWCRGRGAPHPIGSTDE